MAMLMNWHVLESITEMRRNRQINQGDKPVEQLQESLAQTGISRRAGREATHSLSVLAFY
jgi:hypothetical protein